MPYSASGASGEFHILAEITLSGTTLRYAEEDVSIQQSNTTGFFYAGRIPPSGTISRDLGTFLEPKEVISNFDLVLDNRDGAIQTLIQSKVFANKTVNLWIGQGKSKANYSNVFMGTIAHPNGIRWDEDQASFTVIDSRVKVRRILPINKFFTSDYPNVETKNKFQPIPIIYGNWSSAASGGLSVPVACYDTVNKRFKIADHALTSIDRYLKNNVVIPQGNISGVNLTDATFALKNYAYNATDDTVSVNCKGLKTINGTLIEKPADVLRHIQTAHLGLTGTDLVVTAYATLNTDTGSDVVRRWIRNEKSSEVLTSELLSECGADMRFLGGKYSPKSRSLDVATSRAAFLDSDIILEDPQTEKAAFSVDMDPDRFFANKIRSRFRYDPINDQYDGAYNTSSAGSIAEVGSTVERVVDYNWYYDSDQTQTKAARELAIFTTEPMNIQFTSTMRGLLKNPGDQVDITYNVFTAKTVQIRKIDLNLAQMTSRISGFNLFLLGTGRWAASGANNWNAASLDERGSYGFWCTGNYASLSDSTSQNVSRWY